MADSDPIAVLIKFGFLIVLYLFLVWVAWSSLRDLRRADDDPPLAGAAAGAGGVAVDGRRGGEPDLPPGVTPRLEVVAAMGHAPGVAYEIGESLTLGRNDGADVRIDDPFASSAHARIFPRGQLMYIEDMGSTNGTFLNGRQLRRPEQLRVADSVRIGDTEFRYQE